MGDIFKVICGVVVLLVLLGEGGCVLRMFAYVVHVMHGSDAQFSMQGA